MMDFPKKLQVPLVKRCATQRERAVKVTGNRGTGGRETVQVFTCHESSCLKRKSHNKVCLRAFTGFMFYFVDGVIMEDSRKSKIKSFILQIFINP